MKTIKTILLFTFLVLPFALKGQEKTVLGYLAPAESIEMDFAQAGVIGKIYLKEGQAVKQGEPILQLQAEVLQAQLAIAQAQANDSSAISVANAELKKTSSRYSKLSALRSRGTAHSGEIATALADKEKAQGNLSMANLDKKIAGLRVIEIQKQIDERTLKSPINGIIIEINRDVAESVSTRQGEDKSLVKVADISRLKLEVPVPNTFEAQLKVGNLMKVRVLNQSSLSGDRSDAATEVTGVIDFISPETDAASETIRTILMIDNGSGALRAGTHALLVLETPSPALSEANSAE